MKNRMLKTLSIVGVCWLVGFFCGRFSIEPNYNIATSRQFYFSRPLDGTNIVRKQINFAAITNAIFVIDELTKAHCLLIVKKYSYLNSKVKLLNDCKKYKSQLTSNLSLTSEMSGVNDLESNDRIKVLRDEWFMEIQFIESMSSNHHSYEEVFSRMDTDEILLYYYLLSKFRTLTFENIESVVMNKMTSRQMSDLRNEIDLVFNKR